MDLEGSSTQRRALTPVSRVADHLSTCQLRHPGGAVQDAVFRCHHVLAGAQDDAACGDLLVIGQ
ncbi:MAG: hypothetical protein EHM14_02075 [Methanothrix sp.]|nr:MAG: hypothetical protein EHM14_02075 [Methanothrix sp.]